MEIGFRLIGKANDMVNLRLYKLSVATLCIAMALTLGGCATNKPLSNESYLQSESGAGMVFKNLAGNSDVPGSRITYINRQGELYRLLVENIDDRVQTVLSINTPIMSPALSPDGNYLAYVTFEQGHAVVYVQSLLTNRRVVVANFRGSNSAPAWSPDGRQLAIVLTRDGSSQIYLVQPDGTNLRQITFSGAIDTEPNFSPDGQSLIFASDRSGSVQIYRMPLDGGNAERLTSGGGNNFTPRYSPDGKSFVFSHYKRGRFYIATEDIQTRKIQVLTDWGREKKPSFSPDGKLILFATEDNGHGILATVSCDGQIKQKMFPQTGDVRDPMWVPLLKQ